MRSFQQAAHGPEIVPLLLFGESDNGIGGSIVEMWRAPWQRKWVINAMYIEEMNRPVLAMDDAHPAKKFLEAFIDCRLDCCGRELDLGGQKPIDQQWSSLTDGRTWTFSGFAYAFLAFDIELDGFLQSAPYLTPSETDAAQHLPLLRLMMHECAQAARQSGNSEILELTDQVLQMFNLWDEYISFRKEMISRADG